MVALTALMASLVFMLTHEMRNTGFHNEDVKMLYLAEAGVERALREIRQDYVTTTQTGTADLRGASTTGSTSVDQVARIRYIAEAAGNATINANGDEARLASFDSNYTNTRIVSVFLGVRASWATGGTGATIRVQYTTRGSFPQTGNTQLTQALTTTMTTYTADITADRSWTWSTIMSSSFILRAQRTSGSSNINLDSIFLRVTYEIDTNTEPWSTGSYQSYPVALGDGTIQSVSITAEQGKVHLNTASQTLLRYLMEENGVASATADTVATNIVSYRGSNNFDTIEEVQQVSGMTSSIYSAIDQDITVYSYINTNTQRPTGSRAPIDINIASRQVLEAVFDAPALGLGATDPASLATDIIDRRATKPFGAFYSSDSAVTTDFFDFVNGRSYLTSTERNNVLDNADASSLVPVPGFAGFTGVTTEFSYDTKAFKVESVGRVNNRDMWVATVLGDTGSRTFTTYAGDTTSAGYRQENFQ